MISDFLIIPLLTALLAGLLAGLLGPMVVWRRMAYLGDTIAHGALLGVAFALFAHIAVGLGIVASSLVIALVFTRMETHTTVPADATLGILSHGSLALALVIISLSGKTVDMQALLFGDVLAATAGDLLMFLSLLAMVSLGVWVQWKPLMCVWIHDDIAMVEGINVAHVRIGLTLALALTVALSIKVTGVLLITALLILPAVCAQLLAKTPTHMAMFSCALAAAMVACGFTVSFHADTPLSPTIIVAGLGIFLVIKTWQRLRS